MSEKIYSREEVLKKTLEYFNGDSLAANVWINKYALKDSKGNIYEETPNDMHRRIAKEIIRIEKNYPNPMTEDEVFDVLKNFKYIVPQGGPMSGIGNTKQIVSLSNCFVIGNNYDSYGSIMLTDQEQVQLMKRRGGVGHDISHLRPSFSPVKNSALTSTGIVSFMERYSNSTREVGQDGRRGALMLSCSIHHPDAEKFIDAKLEEGKITGANISLRITDDFMKSVIDNKTYIQQFPVDSKSPIIKKEVEAKPIFDKIIHNAWKSAEPGILFWDTIQRESVADCYSDYGFKTTSTNPCGEIPLCPYDSCRLIAINLLSYVNNPFTNKANFDFKLFEKHAKIAQRMMDDIIDLELEKIDQILEKIETDPEPDFIKQVEIELWQKIRDMCIKGRRTGIGVTAEGDMLAALNLTYGTKEATDFAIKVHKTLAISVYKSSCLLAKERGSFEIFNAELEKNNPFIKRLAEADTELSELLKQGRRNISLLTIAPTGTVSLMTQTTSGIEPVFLPAYKRKRKINPNDKDVRIDEVDENGDSWEHYTVLHHGFIKWLNINNYDIKNVMNLSQEELNKLVEKSPYYKATSNDVDWVEKVRMQGEIQKWVDHSISVTVNLPANVTEEIVHKVYLTAWKSGCKGVTVYRDGSRGGVLGSLDKKEKQQIEDIIMESHAPKRPKMLKCDILRFQNNKEKWIGFVGLLNDKPYEIFTGLLDSFQVPTFVENGWIKKVKEIKKDEGKDVKVSRYDFVYIDKDGYEQEIRGLSRAFDREYWNYAKLMSGILRHGMPLPNVISLIDSLNLKGDSIVSWKVGVKRMLKRYLKDGEIVKGQTCPDCGNDHLKFESGCVICSSCGWSKCS
ncbi:MAG: adenosylcobalamin-dependent ribonucleoside-diphosphate reductase [Ignavibacteria bacterium]|nr:adenosylcobalamin-dependent ribonucleoside-diphosphate reductase [Ignavibacteria bacterium]